MLNAHIEMNDKERGLVMWWEGRKRMKPLRYEEMKISVVGVEKKVLERESEREREQEREKGRLGQFWD